MRKLGQKFRARIEARSPDLAVVFDSVPRVSLFADWHDRSNIEALLSFLYAAADLKRDPLGELPPGAEGFFNGKPIDERTARRQEHARRCAILALKACSFILGETSHYDGDRAYLTKVRDLIPSGGPLDVFSVNYDTVIEDFCDDQRLMCINGFDNQGTWQPSVFCEAQEALCLRLWKLHGSVTWVRDPTSGEPKKVQLPGTWERRVLTGHSSSPTTETNLIYPGLGKNAAGPMRLLFDAFAECLRRPQCRVLVAVGYSFADDDIKNLVLDALRDNSNLQLVVLAGNSTAEHVARLVSYHPEFEERIESMSERFEVALNDGSLSKLLRNLTVGVGPVRQSRCYRGRIGLMVLQGHRLTVLQFCLGYRGHNADWISEFCVRGNSNAFAISIRQKLKSCC